MSLTDIFGIAASGMSAQSVRMNTTSSNIANAETVSSSVGTTYKARHPVFAVLDKNYEKLAFNFDHYPGQGVKVLGIVESDTPLPKRYEPEHPMADEQGYVTYPNVNIVEEMANMISASRSFQTNADVIDTAKQMMQRILTLGQ